MRLCSGGFVCLRYRLIFRLGSSCRRWFGWWSSSSLRMIRKEALKFGAFEGWVFGARVSGIMVQTFVVVDFFLKVFVFEGAVFDGGFDSAFAVIVTSNAILVFQIVGFGLSCRGGSRRWL